MFGRHLLSNYLQLFTMEMRKLKSRKSWSLCCGWELVRLQESERIWIILICWPILSPLSFTSPLSPHPFIQQLKKKKTQQFSGRLPKTVIWDGSFCTYGKALHYALKGLFCNSFFVSSLRAGNTSALFPVAPPAFSTLLNTSRHATMISSINEGSVDIATD